MKMSNSKKFVYLFREGRADMKALLGGERCQLGGG